jgi:hypothetical protein
LGSIRRFDKCGAVRGRRLISTLKGPIVIEASFVAATVRLTPLQTQSTTRERLSALIVSRLQAEEQKLHAKFRVSVKEVGVEYCAIDNLLQADLAKAIHDECPKPGAARLMESFREKKFTSNRFDRFDSLLAEITPAAHDPQVIAVAERIAKIKHHITGPTLYAGD